MGGHTADGYPGSKGWGSGPSGAPWGSGPSGTPAPGLNSGLLLPDNLVWSLGRECTGASHLRVPVPLLSGHGWFCAPYRPRCPTRVSSSSLPLGSSYLPSSPLLTSQKIFINHKADQVTPGLQSFPASTLPLRCIPDLPGHYHLLQPSLRTLPVTHTHRPHTCLPLDLCWIDPGHPAEYPVPPPYSAPQTYLPMEAIQTSACP